MKFRVGLCLLLSVSGFAGSAREILAESGVKGGLVVQLGAKQVDQAVSMSQSGRYVIQVLDSNADRIEQARKQIREKGRYGLASAEHLSNPAHLPYTENLVNQITALNNYTPWPEIYRVLAPGGTVVLSPARLATDDELVRAGFVAIRKAAGDLIATKPRPAEMDAWSHSRHGADGNAVSQDLLAGPPQRIRWVAAAEREVEGMVSDGGRNFYGSLLARDSFNGLRLWHRDTRKTGSDPIRFSFQPIAKDLGRPVASKERVYSVVNKTLAALDAATGEVLFEIPSLNSPTDFVLAANTLVACNNEAVAAFEADTGQKRWRFPATQPRNLVAGESAISFILKSTNAVAGAEAVTLELGSGALRWRRDDYPWLSKVARTVLHKDLLAYEVSSWNNDDADNGLHVVSLESGDPVWQKAFPPGMNHKRQARAMFIEDHLWILEGGRVNTADPDSKERMPLQATALDPKTGEAGVSYPAGLAHCFPPVATPNYLFSGVMDLVDLKSGTLSVNPITKANCSRESGWIPANGLVYLTPKHCSCWPILRGYVALAPESKLPDTPARRPIDRINFPLEKGSAMVPSSAAAPQPGDWPLYRNDVWRSGSTTNAGPEMLNVLWTAQLTAARTADGPILYDWSENPFVKGPLSAPTIAGGLAYVTRPDQHEVLAVDANDGSVRWRFTANGRVDTPPALYGGLCLFGSSAGSVYALRADTGELVWRLQAAPMDERIVAYGQVESPWPVPGAVLVMDGTAYFAAGRQSLADGGILLFAVDPMTGARRWVRRIDTIPQKGFYENSGLEFDPFDILHREGDGVTLSRWVCSLDGKDVTVDKWAAFAKLDTGGGATWVPRGSWTYGPRHQKRFSGEARRRPLCVFRDRAVFGSLNGTTELFRRDFDDESEKTFDSHWITGWEAAKKGKVGGTPYRTYRLAENATWKADRFTTEPPLELGKPGRKQLSNDLYGMALDGAGRLYVVHKDGRLKIISAADGSVISELQVPPPAWDGLAIAKKQLFLSTQDGQLVCIGD